MDGRGVEVTHKSAWVANTRGSYPNRYDEGGGRGVLSSPSPNSQILEKNEKKIFWKKKLEKKLGLENEDGSGGLSRISRVLVFVSFLTVLLRFFLL